MTEPGTHVLSPLVDVLARLPVPVAGLYAVGDGYLAVLDERPDGAVAAAIGELHADLRAAGADPAALTGAWAVRADLASPMALGRRWWSVSPDRDPAALDARANTAVRRWLLRHRSTTVLGPDPVGLVAPVPQAVLAAEGLGLARTRGEAVEDDPTLLDDAAERRALVVELAVAARAAAEGTVADAGASLRWCREHLEDQGAALGPDAGPADVRRFVWEVHARLGTLVAGGSEPSGRQGGRSD